MQEGWSDLCKPLCMVQKKSHAQHFLCCSVCFFASRLHRLYGLCGNQEIDPARKSRGGKGLTGETSPRPTSHIPFLSIGLKTLSGHPKPGKMRISSDL